MKIISLSDDVVEYVYYKKVAPGGCKIIDAHLPVHLGEIDKLPSDLEGIIITSDLQGIVTSGNDSKLLGEVVPEILSLYIETELCLDLKKFGVILCGDLFATLEQRGGLGDVRSVWSEFASYFRWVSGVAGNHDSFGTKEEFDLFINREEINYIHNETKEVDNIRLSGIGGIIGDPSKINRIDECTYIEMLKKLLKKEPDILILHQSPENPNSNNANKDKIVEVLESTSGQTLVFSGHNHWEKPLISFRNETQILNVDSRVSILINSGA